MINHQQYVEKQRYISCVSVSDTCLLVSEQAKGRKDRFKYQTIRTAKIHQILKKDIKRFTTPVATPPPDRSAPP